MKSFQLVLDQKTQKRNKEQDVPPLFACYDGENTVNKNTVSIRVWNGAGLIVLAGRGHVQVRGHSDSLDLNGQMQLSEVLKRAYLFNNPDGEQ